MRRLLNPRAVRPARPCPHGGCEKQGNRKERNAERELLPMSRNLDIAFTAWGALGAGLLTGKYNDDPKPFKWKYEDPSRRIRVA